MSKCHTRRIVASLAIAAAFTTHALAAEAGGAGGVYTKDTYPEALPSRPLTLPGGTFELTVPVNVNLSTDEFGKPVALTPSLYYGVTKDVTVGVFHPIAGLCLTGESNGCAKVYNDVGVEAIVNLYRNGSYQLAGVAGLQFVRISDPTLLQALVGLQGKGTFGQFALQWGAGVGFGLTNRDVGNKEFLAVALTPQVEVAHGVALYGTIALDAPFDGFSDLYRIPVGVGLEVTPVRYADVGVEFTFENLLGKNSSTDYRSGQVYGRVRF